MDHRACLVASVIAECNRDHDKRKQPFTPEDFMPRRKRAAQPHQQQDWRSMLAQVEFANAMFGGQDRREKRSP